MEVIKRPIYLWGNSNTIKAQRTDEAVEGRDVEVIEFNQEMLAASQPSPGFPNSSPGARKWKFHGGDAVT